MAIIANQFRSRNAPNDYRHNNHPTSCDCYFCGEMDQERATNIQRWWRKVPRQLSQTRETGMMHAEHAERLWVAIEMGHKARLNPPMMMLADAAERSLALEAELTKHQIELSAANAIIDARRKMSDDLRDTVARLMQENAALRGQRVAVSAALDAREQECKALRASLAAAQSQQ